MKKNKKHPKKDVKKTIPVSNKKKKVVKKTEIKPKERKKINYKKLLIFILIVYVCISIIISVLNFKIKNIIILGNETIKDQEIIEMAKIADYPSFFKTFSSTIKSQLMKNELIKDVKVSKKIKGEIRITIVENHPLFYDNNMSKTVLFDGKKSTKVLTAPILINYVPDNIYPIFIAKMQKIDKSIIARTSEIQYVPNEVDDSRFMFFMTDGNYVYLTLPKFEDINDYVNIMENIIAKFGNKNGILNLDSGGYFNLIE